MRHAGWPRLSLIAQRVRVAAAGCFTVARLATVAGFAIALFVTAALFSRSGAAPAPQPQSQGAGFTVLLDPAHGGGDAGARISAGALEKDVTLQIAAHLRADLLAKNIAATQTRTGDDAVSMPARTANPPARGVCISIHATSTGTGVHLYTALPPVTDLGGSPLLPWSEVQIGLLPQSRQLSEALRAHLSGSGLPVLAGEASVPPLQQFACPAVALEVAPGANGESPADAAYQARVSAAIAEALAAFAAAHARAAA